MASISEDYFKGKRFILCDLICDRLLSSPIVIVDAGALDALAGSRWTKLPAHSVQCHGFEPDAPECAKLNDMAKTAGLDFHFYPIALAGRTGPVEFYRYAEPAANSFYESNRNLIDRWCYTRSLTLASQFELKEKVSLDAICLDDWGKSQALAKVDFIKLNVQGAELDVLLGAQGLLKNTLGLVVEQTFNATYVGAPLFGDVYKFISDAGFHMFDIVGMNRVARTRSPIHITEDRIFVVDGTWPHHQFLEGHFFYLRDPIASADVWKEGGRFSFEQCLKIACLAETFGQIEYAFEMLEWLAASPQAGERAVVCRAIVKDGTAAYREVSAIQSVADIPDAGEVLSAMGARAKPSVDSSLLEVSLKAKVDDLNDRLQTIAAQNDRLNASLQTIYASRTWRTTLPLRKFANWIRRLI